MIFGYLLICIESVLDNTTNPRILQKGSKTEQFRAGTNIGIMFSGSIYGLLSSKARAITYLDTQGRALLTTPPSRPLGLGICL